MGAFLAFHAKNRAFRSKSADLPMQILWDFRFNPLRIRFTFFAEHLQFECCQDTRQILWNFRFNPAPCAPKGFRAMQFSIK
jgi:hypothetical protein